MACNPLRAANTARYIISSSFRAFNQRNLSSASIHGNILAKTTLRPIYHPHTFVYTHPPVTQVRNVSSTAKPTEPYVPTSDLITVSKPDSVELLKTTKETLKWEAVPVEPQVGAFLSFSQLNFFQVLISPYTYSVMYLLDFVLKFLPWWQSIILTTATIRLAFFPLVLKQNIVGIKINNVLPETQKIQTRLNEAMVSGDSYNTALQKTKLQLLYKENGISMKDRLVPSLLQAPAYASMFLLLRALTGIPAEGLSTGGALWFTDLTVPDPYYILPAITSLSMLVLFEFGLEGGASPRSMTPIGRYFIRGLPFGIFLFIQGFPAATLLFWSTSNLFTLTYAFVMRNSWIKRKFNIPIRITHDPKDLPMSSMSFKGQFNSAMDRGKVKKTSMEIRRLDDIAFRKAGVGPLRKTYKEPQKDS